MLCVVHNLVLNNGCAHPVRLLRYYYPAIRNISQIAVGFKDRICDTSTQLEYPQFSHTSEFYTSLQHVYRSSLVANSICFIGRFQLLARIALYAAFEKTMGYPYQLHKNPARAFRSGTKWHRLLCQIESCCYMAIYKLNSPEKFYSIERKIPKHYF